MSHLGLKCFLWIVFLEEQSRTWSRRRRWRWSKTRSSPGSSGRADCPSRTGWSRSQLPTIRRWCHKEILNKWSWRRLDSWVVLHLALNISTLHHILAEVQASVTTNSFLDPRTTSTLSSWFELFDLTFKCNDINISDRMFPIMWLLWMFLVLWLVSTHCSG